MLLNFSRWEVLQNLLRRRVVHNSWSPKQYTKTLQIQPSCEHDAHKIAKKHRHSLHFAEGFLVKDRQENIQERMLRTNLAYTHHWSRFFNLPLNW